MSAFFRKLQWLRQRRRKEAELREELQFHLEEEAEARHDAGLTEDDARWAARRDLGSLTLIEEDTRAAWGWTLLEQFGQDLRYAWRTMAASRLFTLLAVSSLALGIGANTAIYSFMDAILLRALPVADPESLVVLNWHTRAARNPVMHAMSGSTYGNPQAGITSGIFPFPAFELIQQHDELFSAVFAHCQPGSLRSLHVAIGGQADLAAGWNVSGDYFRGLAVPPAAGRLILPDDDRPGAPPVAVISHAFSQRHFGDAASATGQTIQINGLAFTVVGVTPPEFFGVDPAAAPDIYMPVHTSELLGAGHQFGFRPENYLARNYYWIQVMARLRPGVTMARAQTVLAPAFQQWVADTASNDKERVNLPELVLTPGAGGLDTLRRRYSQPLWVLMTLVGLILTLACANVANLLLARAEARRREIALRLSIGASRFRIVRQLLTESVLLASLGGALGVLFAIWGMRFLTLLLGNGRDGFTLHADLNWHVLGVAAALSVLTGIVFGLAPAIQATRVDLVQQTTRYAGQRLSVSRLLVVAQVAISLLLLVAAGLFGRTLSNLESIDPGFNRQDLLLFQLDARKAGHTDPELATFYAGLRERFSAIPGVRGASLADDSIITAGFGLDVHLPGLPPSPDNRLMMVGPDFFTTMEIPLLAGRGVNAGDRAGTQAVAVINEVFAKANFGDRNPLGERLVLWESQANRVGRDMVIVGVARNTRYGGLRRAIPPVVYMPYDQGYPWPNQMVFSLRTVGDPLRYVGAVRDIVRQADTNVPVSDVRTQTADIDRTINQEITFARLCTGFAILALIIACVGLYGTVSHSVARRTGEIGIRMALGAQRHRIAWMVLRELLVLAIVGLAIGASTALGTSRFVATFLYGLQPNDPRALTLAVLIFLAAALVAGYVPARKASRIDPMTAVRHE
jgi:macrolide transport system ATP-binding/permease protein